MPLFLYLGALAFADVPFDLTGSVWTPYNWMALSVR
jgi:hypothetical protein